MEQPDLALIARLVLSNEELNGLASEHERLEREIEQLNKRPFLTPDQNTQRKYLQKLKLKGRDRIEEILHAHRE